MLVRGRIYHFLKLEWVEGGFWFVGFEAILVETG